MPRPSPRRGSVLPRYPDTGRLIIGEYDEPVYLTHQLAYSIVVRLAGTAADRHVVMVAETRYDRVGKVMQPRATTIVHARMLPPGDLAGLGLLIDRLADKAKKLTPAMAVEVHADVTRSPLAYDNIPGDPTLILVATTGMDRFLAPYRYVGRLMILSAMQVSLRTSKLVIALPKDSPNGTIVTLSRLEQALSNVELKTPKVDVEEMLLDTTGPDDDLAITTGLLLLLAEERLISPEDMRFIKANRERSQRWVV